MGRAREEAAAPFEWHPAAGGYQSLLVPLLFLSAAQSTALLAVIRRPQAGEETGLVDLARWLC